MKTIIAGSRSFTDYDRLQEVMSLLPWVTEVVSGNARGVDRLGERWAREHDVPLTVMPADWETHGRSAGYKRNVQMAEYADVLVALWDGMSKGTKHMIDIALEKGLQVWVTRIDRSE